MIHKTELSKTIGIIFITSTNNKLLILLNMVESNDNPKAGSIILGMRNTELKK